MEKSSLLQRLKQNLPTKRLRWPDSEEEIVLHVATSQIWQTATVKASEIFKDVQIGYHNMDDFAQEKLVQALHLCVKDGNDKTFCSITEFKTLVTPEILVWLDDQHAILEEDYSPNIDNMSNDQFDKLISDVKKKPEETLQGVSSIYTLRRVCLYLVNLLMKSQTDK